MNNKILIKNAFNALSHNKARSLLTMLGIIVGIAAIIATLAIGYGAEQKMRNKIMSIGNNYIEIWRGKVFDQGKSTSKKQKEPKNLIVEDVIALKQQCIGIRHISPLIFNRGSIEHKGVFITSQIKGGNEQLLPIMNRKIDKGSQFSLVHIQKNSRVAILGSTASQELFNSDNPIGQAIKVKDVFFTVIGTIKPVENFFGVQDPNYDVFTPYSTAKKFLNHSQSRIVHGIVMSGRSQEQMPQLIRNIKRAMRARHNLSLEEKDDFSIIDQQSMFKAAQASSGIFNLFLLIVASISLLVGGIGVMNIMLVSVAERKQEIGIRMALGATKNLILKQFLIEALTLCFIGGIIGIGLGMITPFGAYYAAGLPVVLKMQPIFISFFTIFVIGLIFGYYPAWKASNLNPVEALTKT